ncbi:secretin [Devosia pacifica]|uniref:Secretin n=1 Tax=Devosia pacifica TaxID=1335967 RepID=A0A918SCA8_9HYPH|nr:type II and III secretion system protein family protein [Devosia pacifica]GHA31934.1 secretin [Devosia pacifica]
MFDIRITSLGSLLLRAGVSALFLSVPLAGHAKATEVQQAHLTAQGFGTTQQFSLDLNKSVILDLPAEVAEVIVSEPNVAGTIMRTTRRAIIQGVSEGSTNIFFLDAAGRTISVIDVQIEGSSPIGGALQSALARIIPGSAVRVESITLTGNNERVVLSGTVRSGADRDKAMLIASQFAGDPENVANLIEVTGSQQVALKVTVAEVKRDVAKQLGINLSGGFQVGAVNFGFNNQVATANNSISAGLDLANVQIDASLRALETRGALHLLAEPVLTTMSGQPANFLAGGEIPYITGYDDNGIATVDFRQYGVELEFTPTINSNGLIAMDIATRVSEPQLDRSLNTRELSTSVELGAGQTLAIAGLLDERSRHEINELPGIASVPILGALFRSREYVTEQTELVVLVTPMIAQPINGNVPIPTDYADMAGDAEASFLGHLEKMYGVGGTSGMRGSISGSVGFVLD